MTKHKAICSFFKDPDCPWAGAECISISLITRGTAWDVVLRSKGKTMA